MQQKAMDKEVAKQIQESRRKEKQEKKVRKTLTILLVAEKMANFFFVKQQANFIVAWSSSVVIEARNKFHYNFKAGLRAHPLRYKGVNLGEITQV